MKSCFKSENVEEVPDHTEMDTFLLKSKFRGSMLGALMGDCLGSAYEGEQLFTAGMKLVIQRSLDKLEGPYFKAPVMQFTDDSAMTSAVAESLIEHKGFDQQNMATKFVKSYYKAPNRGYGAGVTTVFQKLRNNKFVDILGPAREQFNGAGSLGNGAAMRVAPVALFCYKNYELMVDIARKQSLITHTHKIGVDGAILQAIAIHQSLLLHPKETLDACRFTDNLIDKMDKIETDDEGLGLVDPSPYQTQLKLLRKLICTDDHQLHDQKVVNHLGTDISALHSVPTAIYCFLRAQKPIKDIKTDNPLRRTVQYAINWPDDEICRLVSWYKKYPCLWKNDISAYADYSARHCAYRDIHKALKMPDVTFTDVMMKIRETRRLYIHELKQIFTAKITGYKYQPKTKWFYIIHEFLYPYLEFDESTHLNNTDCNSVQFSFNGHETASKKVVQHSGRPPAAGDLRHGGNGSYCEELDDEQTFSLVLEERCSPVDLSLSKKAQNRDRSCPDNSDLGHQSIRIAPLLDMSTHLSQRVKYVSPKPLRIRISRNMHSLQLSDYCLKNVAVRRSRPGVQFILSNDSVFSGRSSSTIVCGKRSDYTSRPVKNFTECGVQCQSSDKSLSVSCNASSLGKETRDSAISVEYDDHDIFAQSIASYLRSMDIETALKAQNQIQKVIDDHRLHKPETQSIRLLRPENSERSTRWRGSNGRFEKSHCIVATARPIHQTYLRRSGREMQYNIKRNRVTGQNSTASSKTRQSKPKADPVITHYERKASNSRAAKRMATDKRISLGGDTDTIGSMAGAIAGAFYGEEMVSDAILKHCESSSEFTNLADELFNLASAKQINKE